jgi:hypothetical protein
MIPYWTPESPHDPYAPEHENAVRIGFRCHFRCLILLFTTWSCHIPSYILSYTCHIPLHIMTTNDLEQWP